MRLFFEQFACLIVAGGQAEKSGHAGWEAIK